MNIYLFERNDLVGYDEYDVFVIAANTIGEAIKIANDSCGDERGIWGDLDSVDITNVGENNYAKPCKILSSFNAG